MTHADARIVQQLADREAIRDCLHRYCRGVDRADEAALRSAYWPGATDRHGPYHGPVEGFIEAARKVWAAGARNVHALSNILIEFRGDDAAAVESYFTALQRGPGLDGRTAQWLLAGRYCDRFEKRGGEWRIAARTVAYDWVEEQTPPTASEAERFGARAPIGGAFPHDPVYRIFDGEGA